MLIFSKMTYRFYVIPIKISVELCRYIKKFIRRKSQAVIIPKILFKRIYLEK